MSPRSFGSTTLYFDDIEIPLKLYSAIDADEGIHFKTLHKSCGTPLQRIETCPIHGALESGDERAKGFEVRRGEFLQLTDEDLDAILGATPPGIIVDQCVPASKLPLLGHEKSYFLGPDKGGEQEYMLLARALRVRYAAVIGMSENRGKQHLVALCEHEHRLLMHQYVFGSEIKAITEIDLPELENNQEAARGFRQLIDASKELKFSPSSYFDAVKLKLTDLFTRRAAGEVITLSKAQGRVQRLPLLEALERSIQRERTKRRKTAARQRVAART